jgi:hypothetical protein
MGSCSRSQSTTRSMREYFTCPASRLTVARTRSSTLRPPTILFTFLTEIPWVLRYGLGTQRERPSVRKYPAGQKLRELHRLHGNIGIVGTPVIDGSRYPGNFYAFNAETLALLYSSIGPGNDLVNFSEGLYSRTGERQSVCRLHVRVRLGLRAEIGRR